MQNSIIIIDPHRDTPINLLADLGSPARELWVAQRMEVKPLIISI